MNSIADPPNRAAALEAEADLAAGRGDMASARALLEQAAESDPDRGEAWLKLAAMCRALGDLPAALTAVSGALRVDPLGFVPLLLKANLLERLGKEHEAGETYGYALAQLPASVAPHLETMVAHARQRHAAHVAEAAARLAKVVAKVGAGLSEPERRRVERFQSNALRQTRPWHSEPSHFHYPGLAEREFHDRELFPWLEDLEAATAAIVGEFSALMATQRAELVPYIQYADDLPLRQWKELNWNSAWTAVHLTKDGAIVEANARHCPQTVALLDRIGQPRIPGRSPNAMFSMLAPRTRIPPHNGVTNTRLVCHLPLIVPEQCWFRVGAETRAWEPGKAFVFDDTIEHEAANDSDRPRVVLIFDVWHPGLSPAERDTVAAIMAGTAPAAEPGL